MRVHRPHVLALALSGVSTVTSAQPASAPRGAGYTVSISSTDPAAVREFEAAYRKRGFGVDESATVTRTSADAGRRVDTASAPISSAGPPADGVTTVHEARARKNGALPVDDLATESQRCNAFLGRAGGTCKVETGTAR